MKYFGFNWYAPSENISTHCAPLSCRQERQQMDGKSKNSWSGMMSINFSGQWGQKLYEVKFEILFTRVSKNGLKIEILGQNSDLNMSRILHTFLKKTFSCLAIRALCISIFNFLPGKAAEHIGNLQEREQNSAHIRTRILIKKSNWSHIYVHNVSFVWNFKCEFKKFLAPFCTLLCVLPLRQKIRLMREQR